MEGKGILETGLGKRAPLLDRETWILAGAVLLLPVVLPYKTLGAEILIYALGAVSFNILLGFTGMLSFGQAMFFGVGAYTAGLFLKYISGSLALAMFACLIASFLAAILIGIVCVRFTKTYFIKTFF